MVSALGSNLFEAMVCQWFTRHLSEIEWAFAAPLRIRSEYGILIYVLFFRSLLRQIPTLGPFLGDRKWILELVHSFDGHYSKYIYSNGHGAHPNKRKKRTLCANSAKLCRWQSSQVNFTLPHSIRRQHVWDEHESVNWIDRAYASNGHRASEDDARIQWFVHQIWHGCYISIMVFRLND